MQLFLILFEVYAIYKTHLIYDPSSISQFHLFYFIFNQRNEMLIYLIMFSLFLSFDFIWFSAQLKFEEKKTFKKCCVVWIFRFLLSREKNDKEVTSSGTKSTVILVNAALCLISLTWYFRELRPLAVNNSGPFCTFSYLQRNFRQIFCHTLNSPSNCLFEIVTKSYEFTIQYLHSGHHVRVMNIWLQSMDVVQ